MKKPTAAEKTTTREYRYKQTRTNHASFAYGKIDNTCI